LIDDYKRSSFTVKNEGKLLPDNNGAERAIRPVTLYRKNSLFAGNEHGAHTAALFFNLAGGNLQAQ
jgi:hypothetical protein